MHQNLRIYEIIRMDGIQRAGAHATINLLTSSTLGDSSPVVARLKIDSKYASASLYPGRLPYRSLKATI